MNEGPETWYSDPAAIGEVPDRSELRTRVDRMLDGLIDRFYAEVPYATHQASTDSLNLEYYKRHNIETILRLRRKRTVDAQAIHYFTKRDPVRAARWAHYVEDEMLHDAWFAADLEKVGVSRKAIYTTEPFFSTKLLTGYLQYGMEFEGSPMALIASVYFVEYTTTKTQPTWVANLGRLLGDDKVSGARRHVGTDLDDKHADFVWGILMALVHSADDEAKVVEHIANVGWLWESYFRELYESLGVTTMSDPGDPAVSGEAPVSATP